MTRSIADKILTSVRNDGIAVKIAAIVAGMALLVAVIFTLGLQNQNTLRKNNEFAVETVLQDPVFIDAESNVVGKTVSGLDNLQETQSQESDQDQAQDQEDIASGEKEQTLSQEPSGDQDLDPEQSPDIEQDQAQSQGQEEVFDPAQFHKDFSYEDDVVGVTASVDDIGVIPDAAEFFCTPIDEKSEEYLELLRKTAEHYGVTDDRIEIYPYNIGFTVDGQEVEPQYGEVAVQLDFKQPIQVEPGETVDVLHMAQNSEAETISEGVDSDGKVESVEVSLSSFSPVVLAKTNLSSPSLKSTSLTDDSGNEYFISKTPNIGNDGVATSQYANSQNLTDVIPLYGTLETDVVIKYRTESTSYDWLYIKDSAGNIIKRDADGVQVGDSNGKIGGGGSNNLTPSNTVHYRFTQDELQFVWRTDSSVTSYGYYAVITPTYITSPIPAYHFEELEDGTYALVFDSGGDIEAFVARPEVKEDIAPYKNKISEIRLHKDTTSVDQGAFKNLTSLKTVTMPRNGQLSKIGKDAFAGCDNMESFTVPSTVTEISGSAFKGCSALETVSFAPDNQMTTLPSGLFSGLTSLRNVTLPTGLTGVSDNLFNGCTSLTNINLPETVTAIGSGSFKNTKLSEIPGLSGLVSIGDQAFANCPNMTQVSIPATVTTLGSGVFKNCANITDFVFEDGTSFPSLGTGFFSGMTKLQRVKLPSDLTTIGKQCFYNCKALEYVDMPETVKSIGEEAFYGCTALKDFEIPASVKSLGTRAFYNCTSLKDMSIPATVTSIGTELFYNCTNLLRMRFEDGSPITTLPGSMFYGCSKLENVKLPDGVSAIPASYFRGCTSLKHVDLPVNLTSIGDYAFYDCRQLGDLVFPNTLKTIGQYAFYNCDNMTEMIIPKSVTSIGQYAFNNCSSLQSVVWEEGSPITSLSSYIFQDCASLEELVLPTRLTSIPNNLAYNCSKLTHVDIPPNVKTIGSSAFYGCTVLDNIVLPNACTNIYDSAFRNSGLTHIDLPPNLISIGNYAFYNTKLSSVVIPKNTTSISDYAFQNNSRLESVIFEGGDGAKNVKIQSYAFADNPMLSVFTTNGRITSIGRGMLQNDRRLQEYVIDPKVTDVFGRAFNNDIGLRRLVIQASPTNTALRIDNESNSSYYNYTFGNLTSLEEFVVDRDLTSPYNRTLEFANINPNVHITIGKNVNNLDNMLVSIFTGDTEITFEGENDFSTTTRIPNTSTDPKWSTLAGDFYADSQGVLYKLNKSDNTASVFYIPKGITNYTVPSEITSVAGQTYSITKIESYAVKSADNLTALVFEDPSKITIPQFAFSQCPSLQTINGEIELYPEQWSEVSLLCDFPVHTDSPPTQVLLVSDSISVGDSGEAFSFGVSISNQEKMDEENPLTYVYPTGRAARLDFAISNESNADMSDRVIRVYFAFTGENYRLGDYVPGNDYTLVNTSTGARYPFKVRETDAKGVYYYDISGFRPGDTLAFNNNFAYESPTSGGGELRVWVESLSAAEAAEREGKTSQPNNYILAEWYTKPTPYNLTKNVLGSPQFEFTSNAGDENDDNIYIRNIQYRMQLSSGGSGSTSYAKDYIKYIDMEDELLLNEHMEWNPSVVAAIANGDYYYNASNNYVYVKVDGQWIELCHLGFPNSSYVRNVYPKVVEKDGKQKIIICWSYRNQYWTNSTSSPTADLPAVTFDLYIGNQAVRVLPGSDLWKMFREGEEFSAAESEAMRQIANKADEVSHYSYSSDQYNSAEAPNRLIHMTTGFDMTKRQVGSATSFGREHAFDIALTNSGLVHKDDVDLVTDTLATHYYIKANDLESMFNNSQWGPFLSVDIASATLCSLPDKDVVDVYGNEFTIKDAQYSGSDPIPYNGATPSGQDNSEITTSAKLSLYWDDTYQHKILEVKNDAGVVLSTYTIGNGCDYETIDAAFKGIGYVVTFRAQYTVTWNLDEPYTLYQAHKDGVDVASVADLTEEQKLKYEYRLKSGHTDTFRIASTVKRTDMMLTGDTPGHYPNSTLSSSNTAYAKDNTGRQVGSASWSGNVSRELSLSKSASANGRSLSNHFEIPDDTVIDYTLSFTNNGDKFDALPLTDKMGGSQVLLVPVRTNRNALYYENASSTGVALQDANIDVYVSNGIQYYVLDKAGIYKDVIIDGRLADTIQVTRAPGIAETLMIWYFQNLDGYTTAGSGTSRSISYKALSDSARLGGSSVDDNGSTITNKSLSNFSWLGGHQTHRLVASLYGESEMLQFVKDIVEDPSNPHENLIKHSLIKDGDEVLYKMTIRNTGETAATIRGNRLHDELPNTGGIFEWSKTNVTGITYVTEGLGSSVETIGDEYWYINSIQPGTGADTATRGDWYIYWTNDFKLDIAAKGEAWIYIRLKFPSSSDTIEGSATNTWDNYIAKNNGATLTNDFYIDQRYSTVTHELVDVVEGVLQKGVLDTGLASSGKFQSEDTRHYYQNGGNTDNGTVQEVAYYTVVYNSGNVRLYLDNLQDTLPKGFKFRGLFNYVPKTVQTGSNITTSSSPWNYNYLGSYYNGFSTLSDLEYVQRNYSSSSIPIATITDDKRTTIQYKRARVAASTSSLTDGQQHISFTIDRNTNNDSYLAYDSALGKYYLNPGEAIRFGYLCTVEGYARTENIANNEVTMPVYDKYGLGVRMSNPEQVEITPATYRDIAVNDGGCDLKTTEEEVQGQGHTKPTWVRSTTGWLSSNVSLQRLAPVPGFLKTVGGETYLAPNQTISPDGVYGSRYTDAAKGGSAYIGTVSRTSIVNWMLRSYNEGGIGSNSMEDYTIVDTVDAPYRFTGNFFYDYYSVDGTKMTSNSVPIFSLGGRSENDTTVKISTGQGANTLTLNSTITINGDPVSVDGGRATVQLLQDNDGNETIKIRLADNYHRLPPNTYMMLVAHTQYVSSDAVLSKQFYNHAQLEPSEEFDPALVAQGHVLYDDESGEPIPYAIESGASVTMTAGYTSAARKQVTQINLPSNTGWSDRDKNSIMLPDKFSQFYYDLYVDLPKDDPTKKLVMIDALPEVGDHSPFVERDLRESEFKVHIIGENPGFTVWSSANLGAGTKTLLGYDQYTLEVSTKRKFEAEDWEGNESGWTPIDLSDGVSAEETVLIDAARSFRIIIDDEDLLEDVAHATMGANYQVQVRFNGELESPADVDPGAIAWNSFGYRYTVPIGATGMMTSLNAEPLKVGVQVPAVPYAIKDQKTPNNHYKSIDENGEYRFLVYTGTALPDLNDVSQMSAADIAGILSANTREFLVMTVPISANTATGQTDYLDNEYKWQLSGDAFAPTTDHWIWINSAKYTILELPWEDNGFRFSDIQHSPVNNYTFTQNIDNNVVLRITNVWSETGSLRLSKTATGPNFDPDRSFTFTITLRDGRYPAFGTYDYVGTNIRDGSITFDDSGTGSIQLKHNQAIEITGLPAGYTYQITESADEWYTQTSSSNTSGTIMADDVVQSSFENTRKSSALSITKNVVGNMGDKEKLFDFEVYILDNGRELSGSYPIVIHRHNGTDEQVATPFVDGAVILPLAHGDTAEITGLPFGARYTVDELAASRKGYKVTSTNDSGVLGETVSTSSFTNTRDGMVPTLQDFWMPGAVFIAGMAIVGTTFILLRKRKKGHNNPESDKN